MAFELPRLKASTLHRRSKRAHRRNRGCSIEFYTHGRKKECGCAEALTIAGGLLPGDREGAPNRSRTVKTNLEMESRFHQANAVLRPAIFLAINRS